MARPRKQIPGDTALKIILDEVVHEKAYSVLYSDLKKVLGWYQYELISKVSERNGKPYEIEITAKIKL